MSRKQIRSQKSEENEQDKNVLPIVDTYVDRRGFLTPPEGFFG